MNGEAGKGDKLRKGANLKAYWENYDNIFKKKDMYYDIKKAKTGDVFYESQYGQDIEMTALEDVRIEHDSKYNGGGAYLLKVCIGEGKEIELMESFNCGGYGLRLYKQPQYS
jgi:hypothetical protein